MSGIDYESYSSYFIKVMDPVAKDYCQNQLGLIYHSNANDLIWDKVKENKNCKKIKREISKKLEKNKDL